MAPFSTARRFFRRSCAGRRPPITLRIRASASRCASAVEGRARNIGVVGLGVGTIAAYGKPGDRIRFYEINPAVAPIAHNLFTYIRDSAAQVDIVDGDARASLVA